MNQADVSVAVAVQEKIGVKMLEEKSTVSLEDKTIEEVVTTFYKSERNMKLMVKLILLQLRRRRRLNRKTSIPPAVRMATGALLLKHDVTKEFLKRKNSRHQTEEFFLLSAPGRYCHRIRLFRGAPLKV